MPKFFFDTRDDTQVFRDDEGLELADFEAAKQLATKSLTEVAADALPTCEKRRLAVEIRDEDDHVMLTSELTFQTRLNA
jgi:hypothetical protein